ncbi:zinc-binding dehydrogenase [bacterium]|nr:zinc-binding dehydrogenase [bacterium]
MMQVVEVARRGGAEDLHLEEQEEAQPGPGQLLIKVKAVSIHAFDSNIQGRVLGYDVAGVVEEVGSGVVDFKVGDEVWSYLGGGKDNHAYAESVCAAAEFVSRKPVNLSFVEAAAVPTLGITAYEAVLHKARLKAGQAALVTGGSGPLGSMIIQLCRHCGANPILATAGSERSYRELTDHLGLSPENVIAYRERSLDDLQQQIQSLTQGHDLAAAFDLVGHRLSQLCFRSIGFGGAVVSVLDQPTDVAEGASNWLFGKSASLHVQFTGARIHFGEPRHWPTYRQVLDQLRVLFEEGHLKAPKVCDLGGFSEASIRGAHELRPHGDALGQLVVRFP